MKIVTKLQKSREKLLRHRRTNSALLLPGGCEEAPTGGENVSEVDAAGRPGKESKEKGGGAGATGLLSKRHTVVTFSTRPACYM